MPRNKTTAHIDDTSERIELECVGCGERITYSPRANQRIRGKIYHDCDERGPPFARVEEEEE